MSRFKYLLEQNTDITVPGGKLIGIFPFNTLIDTDSGDVSKGQLGFLDIALSGLQVLAKKNYNVVVFINQFKNKPLAYESFQSMNASIEKMIKNQGVTVTGIYWCPVVDRNDPYVVPNAGMFTRATENQGIDWKDVPVVSTSDADLKAADRVGAKTIKIGKHAQYKTILDWAESV
jgi:HAD superfamily hydrolase (TIGR01662 family)